MIHEAQKNLCKVKRVSMVHNHRPPTPEIHDTKLNASG